MALVVTQFEEIVEGGNFLFSVSLENYESMFVSLLNTLVNKKNMKGVILAVNRPSAVIKKLLEKNKINQENVVIVDCISSNEEKREGNVIFLQKPFNATTVAIVLDTLISNPEYKFIIFETINTIMIYDHISIVKFFHFMLAKIGMQNKIGIVMGVDVDLNDANTKLIAQACNKIIKV